MESSFIERIDRGLMIGHFIVDVCLVKIVTLQSPQSGDVCAAPVLQTLFNAILSRQRMTILLHASGGNWDHVSCTRGNISQH